MVIWRAVKDYKGVLEVSNTGQVRTLDRIHVSTGRNQSSEYEVARKVKGQILTPRIKNNGYVQVAVRSGGKRKWFLVHRLVADAFIKNTLGLPQVNHKDLDKANNNDWNLEWNTSSQNQNHAVRNGACSNEEKHYKAKLTKEQVKVIINETGLHREIAEKYGVSRHTISCIKARKTWKYVED